MFVDWDSTCAHLRSLGCTSIHAKRLAPNDNSKNQIYIGRSIESVSEIPCGALVAHTEGDKMHFRADVTWSWLDLQDLKVHPAPHTKLIWYTRHDEVRLSGFMLGCSGASPLLRSRDAGRLLVFGVRPGDGSIAVIVPSDDALARSCPWDDLRNRSSAYRTAPENDSDIRSKLRSLAARGWIESCRLHGGNVVPYGNNNNSIGYTMEAHFGLAPNGVPGPDYLGWELKAKTTSAFPLKLKSSPLTLMTTEPDGGLYADRGLEMFLKTWGYQGDDGRWRITGRHFVGAQHERTGLRLQLTGFDPASSKLTNINGGLELVDADGTVALRWSLSKLLSKWKGKHQNTAIVPAMRRVVDGKAYFRFDNTVLLCEGGDIYRMLHCLAARRVYFDPGHYWSPTKSKKRTMLRITLTDLPHLFTTSEFTTL